MRFPLFVLALTFVCGAAAAERWIHAQPSAGDFTLANEQSVAAIVYSADDFKVVAIAANDLAADVERVTGKRPILQTDIAAAHGPAVLIGTLGQSAVIDTLVRAGKIDVASLRGAWESFLLATIANPTPGVPIALAIVGSDRRGTAFGAYELSQAIGVSPWHWWADVAPERKSALYVTAGTRRFGPPSVKYRGVFLNDEDWGLQPWAAKTFEPENGDIGPKTYAKLFELMLRLKANTVWPAMHACTKPFNDFPANRQIADDYAIVMGSSHAEPMLRNNVGEWKDAPEKYNYVTNRDGVRTYWEQRVKENGRFENIYTLGMRGIHDSGIQGAKTDTERIKILEQVFADQREMLEKWVRPTPIDPKHPAVGAAPSPDTNANADRRVKDNPLYQGIAAVPQIFCAYKEVLGLYRQGLKVPDDVTIVWPDDNFGYIRNYATPEERKRSGGFGIYYHLSYLGAPMSYLWLYTTPPALVWEEMTKAYDYGARTLWIANVGDLKPAEIGTEFFLQLAWDVNRWSRESLPDFLAAWAEREFGAEHAKEIAAIMAEYYRLNYERKPEHLQWWLPKESPRPSPLSRAEVDARLAAFRRIRAQADKLMTALPTERRDAFFELVVYPIDGSALANERYFGGELAALAADASEHDSLANRAMAADAELKELTRRFNAEIAGGKWRRMAYLEPADDQWKSFRISKWSLPKFDAGRAVPTSPPAEPKAGPDLRAGREDASNVAARPAVGPYSPSSGTAITLEAERFDAKRPGAQARWEVISGLGRSDASIAVFPNTVTPVDLANAAKDAPCVDYRVTVPSAGNVHARFFAIPTQPIVAGRGLRFAIAVDDAAPEEVVINVRDGSAEWAQGVLNAAVSGTTTLTFAKSGPHVLHVYGTDPGVVLDRIVLTESK